MISLEQLKAACALIRTSRSQGTGYLVAPNRIATCEHVVRSADRSVELDFHGNKLQGEIVSADEATDCALIELPAPLDGVRPLPLAGRCTARAGWQGYGFPKLALGAGIPLHGEVLDPESMTDHGKPAITLFSQQIAAGMADKVHGYSGSPIVVNGMVVGHLSKVISALETPGRPAFGVIYAARSAGVLKLLGQDAAVPEVRPAKVHLLEHEVPSLPEGSYHAFISYRSTDREWALVLVARLEGLGLRVFMDQRELLLGDRLADRLQMALSNSRAAVVLISKGWLESPWCQEEENALLQRLGRERDFRVVPLRLDDAALPAFWAGRLWLDLRGKDPSGAPLEQIAYALLGKRPPAPGSEDFRVERALTTAVDEALPRLKRAAALGVGPLRTALRAWREAGLPMIAVSIVSAEALLACGHPEEALEVLAEAPVSLRSRQLRALALSKSGQVQESIVLLKELQAEGHGDAETMGLLGGRLKERWFRSRFDADLFASYEAYREGYERTGNSYPGINAAALALWLSDRDPSLREDSRRIAQRLLEELGAQPEAQLDHFQLATLGEAFLLLGDEKQARTWYRKAVGRAYALHRVIAMMRIQARLDLKALGRPEDTLDGVLPTPRVVVFSGHLVDAPGRALPRFPETKVAAVKRELERRLDGLGKAYGFSSGARGADVLFLEVLLARDGVADVYLPFALDDFKAESVGGEWNARLDRVLANENVKGFIPKTPAPPQPQQPEAFARCNEALMEAAEQRARLLGVEPLLLVVWDMQEGGTGGAGSVVAAWRERGHPMDIIELKKL